MPEDQVLGSGRDEAAFWITDESKGIEVLGIFAIDSGVEVGRSGSDEEMWTGNDDGQSLCHFMRLSDVHSPLLIRCFHGFHSFHANMPASRACYG